MKEAKEQFEEAGADPTMDEIMRRDPANLTASDRRRLIEVERQARASFNVRKEPKDEG